MDNDKEQLMDGTPLLSDSQRSSKGLGRQAMAVSVSCLPMISCGIAFGSSAPLIPTLTQQGILTQDQATWYSSMVTLGGLVWCPLTGIFVDRLGRKSTMLLMALPVSLGWFMTLFGPYITVLYIGRFLIGTSVASPLVVSSYIAEITHPSYRGRFGLCSVISMQTGVLICYMVGIFLPWRWIIVVCMCPTTVFVILMLAIPESPRWYISKGDESSALNALKWLRNTLSDEDINDEWEAMRDWGVSDNEAPISRIRPSELMSPHILKPFFITFCTMTTQQLTGTNAIRSYAFSIFQESGYFKDGGLPSVTIAILQGVGACTSTLFVDRIGRCRQLIISGLLMGLSCILCGLSFYFSIGGWLTLFSLSIYNLGGGLGWAPVPIVVASELLPRQWYGLWFSICMMGNTVAAFLVIKSYFPLEYRLQPYGIFWVYGTVCLLGSLFVAIFLPETKGKSLDEIQAIFKHGYARIENNIKHGS